MTLQCSYEFAIDLVDEWLVGYQRAHCVHVGCLSPLDRVFVIASLRENIPVVREGTTKRFVKLGFAEFGTGAIDRADGGGIPNAVSIGC